jgi:hypothetical protein
MPRQKKSPVANRRSLRPNRIRALELLAGCGACGCPEGLMVAHGFAVADMVELVRAGLATATTEHVVMSSRTLEGRVG